MKLYIFEHCPFSSRCVYVARYLNIKLDIECVEYYQRNYLFEKFGDSTIPLLVLGNEVIARGHEEIIAWLINDAEISDSPKISASIIDWESRAIPVYNDIISDRIFNMGFSEFSHEKSRARYKLESLVPERKRKSEERLLELGRTSTKLMHEAKSVVLEENRGVIEVADQSVLFSILRSFYLLSTFERDDYLHRWLTLSTESLGLSLWDHKKMINLTKNNK